MTFENDKVEEFLEIFEKSKKMIRNFPGCTHLELHRDYNAKNIYITYSNWKTEQDLNNYRNSELFKNVWTATKALFSAPPIAFSNQLADGPI